MKVEKKNHFFPEPMVLIFYILLFTWLLTWIVPAGMFDRIEVNGRMAVIADSFHYTNGGSLSPLAIFFAIPRGLVAAAPVIFITFVAGGLFHLLASTHALENTVGTVVKKIGQQRRTLLVWIMTFIFGLLGIAVGYENNIALVPIAVLVGLAIGGDLLVGLGIAIGGIGFGFATSPINPYTVGVADSIAQLPLFSGALPRTLFSFIILCLTAHHTSKYLKVILANPEKSLALGLSTEDLQLGKPINDYQMSKKDWLIILTFLIGLGSMLVGIFAYKWYINEISGIFLAIAVITGIIARFSPTKIVETFCAGAAAVTRGALLIGFARAIQVLLDDGGISDTIINALATPLTQLPVIISTLLMSVVHGIINLFIPSGSGQAMATMPIMIPLSDLIGMTRQVAISAFQVGDGFTNMVAPTSGGTLAMLALAGVPYNRWVKFFFPLLIKAYIIAWIFLALSQYLHWN